MAINIKTLTVHVIQLTENYKVVVQEGKALIAHKEKPAHSTEIALYSQPYTFTTLQALLMSRTLNALKAADKTAITAEQQTDIIVLGDFIMELSDARFTHADNEALKSLVLFDFYPR